MSNRYIRNTVITAAIEATAGSDASPTGAANAVLAFDVNIDPLDAQNIKRTLMRGYFGGSDELVGPGSVKVSFSMELAGSGTAGTAPAWGAVVQACAFAEGTLATPARVEYTPVSTLLKTVSMYYYDDGVRHKVLGAMGNLSISAKVGERPLLKCEFTGLDGGIAAAMTTGTYTAWKKPVAMTKANVIDITLGATYANGVLTGGTVYPSTGLDVNLANAVSFEPLLSEESVDITDREPVGNVELKLTAAEEVAFYAQVKTNATQSMAITIGTVAGNKIIVFMPSVQLRKPKKVDRNGKRLVGYEVGVLPLTGNDEIFIICL